MKVSEYYVGPLGPILLLVAIIVALTLFIRTLYIKFSLFGSTRSEKRWDNIPERIKGVITFVLLQKRLFKDPIPGLMHFFIFWGFCILLIRALTLYGMGFSRGFHLPFMDGTLLAHLYELTKELFVLFVTAAVLYALYRRLILRPPRLTLSFEGNLILLFILMICLTDLLLTASLNRLGEETTPFSFAGLWLGRVLADSGGDDLFRGVASISYWLHVIIILVFLNLLPHSKHFHVITSIPNVFFRNLRPRGGTIAAIDFEKTEEESFGISRLEEFTWKTVLDSYTCTQCGRCFVHCPANLSEKPLKPKEILVNLRRYFEDLSLRKGGGEDENIFGKVLEEETLWSCTTCANCEEECPVCNEFIPGIVGMRQYLVMMESRFPAELKRVFRGIETGGNPWGMGGNRRFDWASGLDVPLLSERGGAEYLFFIGCAGSYDDRCIKVTKGLIELFNRGGLDYAVLGPEETCCGDVARRTGNEYLFYNQSKALIEVLKDGGVEKVIASCPHGYNTFKNEYPDLGGRFEVFHHTEILNDLLEKGRLKPEKGSASKVAFHDSCYLGRYNGIYREPREILKRVVGPVAEPSRTGVKGLCCGGGGGWAFREEKGKRMNHLRVLEIMEKNPDVIAVECPFCIIMLEDAIKSMDLEEKVGVRDISEIILQNIGG